MTILLPASPGVKTAKVHMLDWGGALTPSLGGPTQTLMRLGTRSAVDFELPTMPSEPQGRTWAAALRMAKLYGALFPFPQDGFKVGAPGGPVVDGAGQSGTTLTLRGFTPSYAARFGQAFSIVHGGRRYLHFMAAQGIAGAGGKVSASIFPMLRVIPSDGDVCEFGKPMIQGSLSGNEVAWQVRLEPFVDIGSFTITEDE